MVQAWRIFVNIKTPKKGLLPLQAWTAYNYLSLTHAFAKLLVSENYSENHMFGSVWHS
jgi:hypothetical protein